MNVIHL